MLCPTSTISLEARAVPVRVEILQRVLDCGTDIPAVEGDRRVRGIDDLPDLKALSQRLVAEDLVGDVEPRFRAAREPVQRDEDVAIRIVRLHEINVRGRDAAGAPEHTPECLPREAGLGEPQRISRGEVGSERHVDACELDRLVSIGVERYEIEVIRAQDFIQRVAAEADDRRDGWNVHLGERLLGIGAFVRFEHGHHLGAETVASVDVSQPCEAQRRRGDQFLRQSALARGTPVLDAQVDPPSTLGEQGRADRRPALIVREDELDGLLHGNVVVIDDVHLPLLEGSSGWLARGEEEVSVGVARRLQVGVPDRLGVRLIGSCPRETQRSLEPELRECRQLLLVGEQRGAHDRIPAPRGIELAGRRIDAEGAHGVDSRPAQSPGAQDIAAVARDVVPRLDRRDRDAGAARERAEQRNTAGGAHDAQEYPAAHWDILVTVMWHVTTIPVRKEGAEYAWPFRDLPIACFTGAFRLQGPA